MRHELASTFAHSHTIRVTYAPHDPPASVGDVFTVMLVEYGTRVARVSDPDHAPVPQIRYPIGDGYTRLEWEEFGEASWRLWSDGTWRWRGRPELRGTLTVEVVADPGQNNNKETE
jgi:hypothetical protein